jgi:WhiB family redox-sensing transcriptional regulator
MADSDWRSLADGEFSETVTLEEWRRGNQIPAPEPAVYESRPYDPLAAFVNELTNGAPAWMADAACRGMDQHVFFPMRGDPGIYDAPRRVCAACPVRSECLEYALVMETRNYDTTGMWGGLTVRERKALRRYRKKHPEVAA